ncbi:MAG TPA: VWA domain-containing protein [Gammaproteobacteria bacterium]|nr:VWA domain-containing protein [Gammaproteobacteria bacterium]
MTGTEQDFKEYRKRLRCSVAQVDDIFEECMREALELLSPAGVDAYLDGASVVCGLGRGTELVLIFLQGIPVVAHRVGEEVIPEVVEMTRMFSRTAHGKAINPFLSTLPAVARRLEEMPLVREYFGLLERMAREAGNGLIPVLQNSDRLLHEIPLGGLKNWIEYGLRGYRNQPHRMADYFGLQSADSQAALQRERRGTLYVDHERKLDLFLRALWEMDEECHPYSLAFDRLRKPSPYIDRKGFHIPDVYEELEGITGIDRYRALLAHLAAHRLYTEPYIADNFSPFQQMVIETFEDARVEALAMQRFPGLRRLWMALHPIPKEGECGAEYCCIRHELAMLSRALLDPDHPYRAPHLLEYVERFHERMARDPHDGKLAVELGVKYLTAIHTPAFRQPRIWFKDTEVSYRDDNRYMWLFLEDTDNEDDFHSDHAAANPRQAPEEGHALFSRHHMEWDYQSNSYRPDWVTVYESLQEDGSAARIDRLLEKNSLLARRLKRIIDMLKPQQPRRVRFQEDGSELDLDIAIRAMVDYRAGVTPDTRINMSTQHSGRDIAVTLLLDLSASINETPAGSDRTILELSQEAVSLLAWAIDQLGDPFAIAGFASNTRHEVRYLHFKGFNEPWNEIPKARLAAMQGGYSTRMGAAIRHAGHYLGKRDNDKKLLLILTDGEPSDIDTDDPEYLLHDTKKAVEELSSKGIGTYCISLDPNADDYVSSIFGRDRYAVIDHVDRLPEKLPHLFMSITSH